MQKQINMVHTIIRNKLDPQIKELELVIASKGTKYVLERYPQMIDIVVNIDKVKEQIAAWKSMSA